VLKLIQNTFLMLLIFSATSLAQSFGFGCLGFVGGFGGYNYQQYKPDGLNRFVDNFNSQYVDYIDTKMEHFGKASGYRVGVNVFRAKFTGFLFTAKGFYQQLHEEHTSLVYQTAIGIDYEYDLKIRSYGIGIDLGIPVTSFLSWKIVDGSLLINGAKFTKTINSSAGTDVSKYNNEKTELGYTIGSGFIFEIVKNYISLEGSASYTQLTIDKMINENGSEFLYSTDKKIYPEKFIEAGGFNAVVQLNLGFPL
jgi:hypothetical protein